MKQQIERKMLGAMVKVNSMSSSTSSIGPNYMSTIKQAAKSNTNERLLEESSPF